MTGLWTNDRAFTDRVHRAISVLATGTEDSHDQSVLAVVYGITSAVRVLDPDDTGLREQIARALFDEEMRGAITWKKAHESMRRDYRRLGRAVIVALRQP
jgi:hypothetical protein